MKQWSRRQYGSEHRERDKSWVSFGKFAPNKNEPQHAISGMLKNERRKCLYRFSELSNSAAECKPTICFSFMAARIYCAEFQKLEFFQVLLYASVIILNYKSASNSNSINSLGCQHLSRRVHCGSPLRRIRTARSIYLGQKRTRRRRWRSGTKLPCCLSLRVCRQWCFDRRSQISKRDAQRRCRKRSSKFLLLLLWYVQCMQGRNSRSILLLLKFFCLYVATLTCANRLQNVFQIHDQLQIHFAINLIYSNMIWCSGNCR